MDCASALTGTSARVIMSLISRVGATGIPRSASTTAWAAVIPVPCSIESIP